MKKLICAILCIAVLIISFTVPGAADTCKHSYIWRHYDKNCISNSKTVYTCNLCGDSYTVYDWEYDVPDDFALLFESVRDEDNMTLTVTVTMMNNPGLLVSRIKLGYNASTLIPVSFENGTVWDADDYFKDIDVSVNPITLYTEEKTDSLNRKNGLCYTLVFSIADPNGDYGFEIIARKSDFSDDLSLPHQPGIIDRIGKKEYGDHLYSEPETVLEPTFDTVGRTVCRCAYCAHEKYGDIPVLEHWKRGDINNDDKVNAGDCVTLKRIIVGKIICDSLQMRDAADLNHDNKINATDAVEIKRVVVGKS